MEGNDLKITVEQPAAWARRLTITVPAERVDRERRSVAKRLAKQARLPGFRRGKVPAHLLEKRYGPAIQQEALERVLGDAYREAIRREGLEPIKEASVDHVDYTAGSDLTFHVDLEVVPQIELNRLGGFAIKRPRIEVPESEVDRVIDELRRERASWFPLAEPPVVGDRVVVEIRAIPDSPDAPQPDARRYELELGSGQAAESIETAIRTLAPGESGECDVELSADPDDPASPMESHRLHVALIEARRAELPELDDEFAVSLGGFADLAELRARVRSSLEAEVENEIERAVRAELVTNLLDANPFELPPSMVDEYLERAVPAQPGVAPDRLEEIRASARPSAERAVRRALVLRRIADMESLHATPDEIDQRIAEIADRIDRPRAEVRADLARGGQIAEIEDAITESKVFDYLKSLSTIE